MAWPVFSPLFSAPTPHKESSPLASHSCTLSASPQFSQYTPCSFCSTPSVNRPSPACIGCVCVCDLSQATNLLRPRLDDLLPASHLTLYRPGSCPLIQSHPPTHQPIHFDSVNQSITTRAVLFPCRSRYAIYLL
ncbi:hypothetical protein LY78DRAFT_291586 [Colletotrichum sublineola]|nr:hypothetical protein LY78DRAFT_291586 [Colletotrichum sublineola]